MVAVYVVERSRSALGFSVTVCEGSSYETVAPTVEPSAARSVTEVELSEEPSIDFENVAVTVVLSPTPPAPAAGVVAVTVGGAGGAVAVLNVQVTAVPSEVVSSLVLIEPASVAVYDVFSASVADGVKTARFALET